MDLKKRQSERQVAYWLLTGVGMIMMQVLLGGITRLTGSGLSITEWKPILGTLPPLSESAWQEAFAKYREIGQFKHLNFDFTLGDFKFIYFWEWFHRVWARLIALVFLVPFLWFLWKRKFNREMILPMLTLFLLGALQGAIGWIMVLSGLNQESLYVSHLRLALHFMAALCLLVYTWWFALRLIVPDTMRTQTNSSRNHLVLMVMVLGIQLVFGAFMAGLKAGSFATTWPLINGAVVPGELLHARMPGHFMNDPIAVQFIHRTLGYVLALWILFWFFMERKRTANPAFRRTLTLPLVLVFVQVALGIAAVIHAANGRALLWWGVAHQGTAMVLLMSLVWQLFLVSRPLRTPV